jgi:NADPH2:quinone reductase
VQLARAAGARVFATARDEAGAVACRTLGAELVWNPADVDVTAAVLEATGGAGVDVAIDPVGGDAFDQTRRCMGFEGRLVVVGFVSGRIAELRTNALVLRNFAVLGVNNSMYMARRPEVHRAVRTALLGMAREQRIEPLIAGTWAFEDAPDALVALGAGSLVGKALVTL